MTSAVIELPASHIRLLGWFKEVYKSPTWRRSSAVSAVQWILKFGLILAGVSHFGHMLVLNAVVSAGWDWSIYFANRIIWRSRQIKSTHSAKKFGTIWLVSLIFNQGLTMLLCGPGGMSLDTAKLVLIPQGLAMNPIMYWVNDQYVFCEGGLRRLWRAVR